MRIRIPLSLALCLLLAGCLGDEKETGISRSKAIAIAENHCSQYPDRFGYVDRSEWNPDGHYWMIALTDRDGDHGRAYKISPGGSVIDSHVIDRSDSDYDHGYGGGSGPDPGSTGKRHFNSFPPPPPSFSASSFSTWPSRSLRPSVVTT